MNLSRNIVVALAVAALVAPTAAAKPIDAPVPDRAQPTLPGPLGPPSWLMEPQPPAPTVSRPASDGVDGRTLGVGAGLALVAMAGAIVLVRARQRPRVA